MSGSMNVSVAIIDYGAGNLRSAAKAFERQAGELSDPIEIIVTADPDVVRSADRVVLPGVGAFADCRAGLYGVVGMVEALREVALTHARPFLGICVGMQMLFTRSEEDESAEGLDIIPGKVCWIPTGPKIPQMQWNRLQITRPVDPMLADLGDDAWFYFVHSLHGVPDDPTAVAATVEYGTTLNAAFRRHNVFAVQFHPEKSSTPGLTLLASFVATCDAGT